MKYQCDHNHIGVLGLCRLCHKHKELVTVRFVVSDTIQPFWSRSTYEEYIEIMEENNKEYKVYNFQCRAHRVCELVNLLQKIEEGEKIEAVELQGIISEFFFKDIMGIASDKE